MKLVVDAWQIASVGVDKYARFQLEPGTHTIGLSTGGSMTMQFDAGEVYYFYISPSGGSDFEIERVNPERGREMVSGASLQE
jgi:hypothetical protein